MKVKLINQKENVIRIVFEEEPARTYIFNINEYKTEEDVITEIKKLETPKVIVNFDLDKIKKEIN